MAKAIAKRQSSRMDDREDAIAVQAFRRTLRALRDEPVHTLADALARYERDELAHLAPSTQDWRRRAVLRLQERYGARPLERDWIADAHALHDDVRLTPISAAMCVNTLGRILNLARDWGWVDRVPRLGKLGWLKGEGKDLPYTLDDVRLLLARLYDLERARTSVRSRVICALRFLALTGWRPSEVTWLRWSELRHGGRVAQLPRTKTGPETRVLSDAAVRVLHRRPAKRGSSFVFWGRRCDHGVTKNAMRYTLAVAARAAGVEDPGLRRFRYTAASVFAKNIPDAHAGKLLGHDDVRSTRGYQLALFDDLVQSANVLARAIGEEDEQ